MKSERRSCKKYNDFKSWGRIGKTRKKSVIDTMRSRYDYILMGNFKNDIFGDYIRYTHASCHSYVVVNIDGKILVVNGENDAETKEIYQRIIEKVSKERK